MTGKSLDDESEWGWKLGIGSAKRWAAKKGKKNKDKGEVSMRMTTLQTCSAGEREGKQINKRDCRSWWALFSFFFGIHDFEICKMCGLSSQQSSLPFQ